MLNRLKQERGAPKILLCGRKPEFTDRIVDEWLTRTRSRSISSLEGKPTYNAFCDGVQRNLSPRETPNKPFPNSLIGPGSPGPSPYQFVASSLGHKTPGIPRICNGIVMTIKPMIATTSEFQTQTTVSSDWSFFVQHQVPSPPHLILITQLAGGVRDLV